MVALNEAQDRLDSHHLRKTEGLALRAKIDNYELGEKSNAYFLNIIKSNQQKSIVSKLKLEDGQETVQQDKIMELLMSFYSNLFSKKK